VLSGWFQMDGLHDAWEGKSCPITTVTQTCPTSTDQELPGSEKLPKEVFIFNLLSFFINF
jgi:hypothetical protein